MATIAERNVLIRFNTDAKKAKREIQGVGKEVKGLSGLASQASATFAGLFAFDIAQSTIQGITSFAKGSAQAAISFEQTQVAFETFLGSAAKASQVLAELQEFSTLTPFEPEQVISAGQALLAFGVNAEDLTSTLGKLGDISAGTGTDFNELAQLFGKARVQGRLFGEDINQLTGRGIPVIAEFAKQFGVAQSEVKKLVSEGKIGFPELEKAFTSLTSEGGKFFDLTAKQSQTVGGRISTLVGNFNELQKEIGQGLLPAIGAAVDFFNRFVGSARELTKIKLSEQIADQRTELNILTNQLQETNLEEEDRLGIILELQKQYPGFLKNIDAEKISNEELLPILEEINQALIARIALEIKQERAAKVRAKIKREETVADKASRAAAVLLTQIQEELGNQIDVTGGSLKEQAQSVVDQINANRGLIANNRQLAGAFLALEATIKTLDARQANSKDLTEEYTELTVELRAEQALIKDQVDKLNESNEKSVNTLDKVTGATRTLTKAEKDRLKELEKLEKGLQANREADAKAAEAAQKEIDKAGKDRRKAAEQRIKDEEELNAALKASADEDEAGDIDSALELSQKLANEQLDSELRLASERRNALLAADGATAESREEAQRQFALESERIAIERLEAQLITLEIGSNDALNIEQEIENRRTQLVIDSEANRDQIRKETAQKNIDNLNKIVEANKAAADAINQIGQALFGEQIKRLDEQIEAQEENVSKALKNAEKGGAEQLEQEETRLAGLNAARERAANQLRIITAIEVAANQAAAVASGIAAVTKAFATGGLIEGIATSVALGATIATSIIALNNAFSDVPAFADGTEFFDGVGGPRSDSNTIRISRGERIVPTHLNEKYFDTLNEFQNGTPMADLLHGIASGNISMPMVSDDRQVSSGGSGSNEVVSQLERMNRKLGRLEMNVTLDKDGFAASMSKYSEKKSKLRNKING